MDATNHDTAELGAAELRVIADAFDVMAGPLEAAAAVLEPLKLRLDTSGVVFDLVVQPVLDFLTKTLGIDALLDGIKAEVQGLLTLPGDLPLKDFLNDLFDEAQSIFTLMEDFVDDRFGIFKDNAGYLTDLEAAVFGNSVGDARAANGSSPTWYGDAADNTIDLSGRTDSNGAVFDGKAGKDTIVVPRPMTSPSLVKVMTCWTVVPVSTWFFSKEILANTN